MKAVARVVLVPAVAAYNWWVAVPFQHGMLRSTNSFFSDLEVRGEPHAAAFGHLDVVAGSLFLLALLLRGRDSRPEWPLFVAFAVAVAVGGLFPFACAEGTNPGCRRREWHLRLPAQHYAHVAASAVEFLSMTAAVLVGWRRSRDRATAHAAFRALAAVLVVGYLPLAVAYFSDKGAALVEPVFFVAFSAAVVTEVAGG